MFTQREITRTEHHAWWEQVRNSPEFAFFIYKRKGASLGYVAFSDIDPSAATATWGFYAAPSAPRGTGSTMGFVTMDMAFGSLGLKKLNADVLPRNAASIRLHESLGFASNGLFRDYVRVEGRLEDAFRFSLLSEGWFLQRQVKIQSLIKRLSK